MHTVGRGVQWSLTLLTWLGGPLAREPVEVKLLTLSVGEGDRPERNAHMICMDVSWSKLVEGKRQMGQSKTRHSKHADPKRRTRHKKTRRHLCLRVSSICVDT
jgi:hypothetical protein